MRCSWEREVNFCGSNVFKKAIQDVMPCCGLVRRHGEGNVTDLNLDVMEKCAYVYRNTAYTQMRVITVFKGLHFWFANVFSPELMLGRKE